MNQKPCHGTNRNGYLKGSQCGAAATLEQDGKTYCHNHVDVERPSKRLQKPAKPKKERPAAALKSTRKATKGVVLHAAPIKVRMVCQKWEESERGWGTRPDGYTLHRSMEDLQEFLRLYWAEQPKDYVPDEYSRPSGKPYWCEVDAAMVLEKEEGVSKKNEDTGWEPQPYHKHGFWGPDGNNYPAGDTDGWMKAKP